MIPTQPLDASWHPKIKHFGLDLMVEKHEYYGTYYEYEIEYNALLQVAQLGDYQVVLPLEKENLDNAEIISVSPIEEGRYLAIMLNDPTFDERNCGYFALAQRVESGENLYVTVMYHESFHVSYRVRPRGWQRLETDN
jgi:hypothetical protein